MTQSFDIFFDLDRDKRLSKRSRRRWSETPSRSLWCHCNIMYYCLLLAANELSKTMNRIYLNSTKAHLISFLQKYQHALKCKFELQPWFSVVLTQTPYKKNPVRFLWENGYLFCCSQIMTSPIMKVCTYCWLQSHFYTKSFCTISEIKKKIPLTFDNGKSAIHPIDRNIC